MLTYASQKAVSTRDLAWGHAGENVTDAEGLTASDLLALSGTANWGVRKVPLTTTIGDDVTEQSIGDAGLLVPNQYATVADIGGDRKVLGVVGERYQVFQNEDCVDLLDTIVDESGAHFVAGGHLANYRKMFAVMKLPRTIMIGGEDQNDLYFGVTSTHDGSGSLTAWVTGLRLKCTNMLNSSVKGAKSKWTLRHTSNMHSRSIVEAQRSLAMTFKWADEFEAAGNAMLDTKISDAEWAAFLDQIAPKSESEHEGWVARQEEKRGTLNHLFFDADTNEQGRGTRWAAYQSVTEYADWYLPIKGVDTDGLKRAQRNMDSATVSDMKQMAFNLLVPA